MAAYAKQANDKSLIRMATELKIRAERRAGEMLIESKLKGDRHTGYGDQKSDYRCVSPIPTLAEIGISRNQSSRWQKLAAVPETQFEQAVQAALEVAGEVTTEVIIAVREQR